MNCIYCHYQLTALPLGYYEYHCSKCRVNYQTHDGRVISLHSYINAPSRVDYCSISINLKEQYIRLHSTHWPTDINVPLEWVFPHTMKQLFDRVEPRVLALRAFA